MSVSRIHHCISQEMVSQQFEEPPAKKCTCRKFIPYKKADAMVKNGEARWCVVKRERGTRSITCSLCGGDPEVKNCAKCAGLGAVVVPAVWDTYTQDIVLTSQASHDEKEKKYRPALAMKTPRVATIESEHIERAYNGSLTSEHPRQWKGDGAEARDRIEEYGMLILDARTFVGPQKCAHAETHVVTGLPLFCARCLTQEGEGRIPAIGKEPENDAKAHQGRDHDYGRTI